MKFVMFMAVTCLLSACSDNRSDAQRRRDVESFVAARDACLVEIERAENQRHPGAGTPKMTSVPRGEDRMIEGEVHKMHLEYELPGLSGPSRFNEAECQSGGNKPTYAELKR